MNRRWNRIASLYTSHRWVCIVLALFSLTVVSDSQAAFHFMQMEQIIGGVNGDTTAQAIQLRTRQAGQNFVASTRITARDATGSNPVLLEDMTANVPNGQAGRRILITTPNFANYTNIPLVSDFTMDPIPLSYLAAGQVRFSDDFGFDYWLLSWGGSNFTGSTTANSGATNDNDGNYGPPVNMPLPTETLQALRFTGTASALSTTNLADYALTAGAATFINNANQSFTLVAPDPPSADFDNDGDVDGRDFLFWQRGASPNFLSPEDLELWQEQYGAGPLVNLKAIPEPATACLVAVSCVLTHWRRVRH